MKENHIQTIQYEDPSVLKEAKTTCDGRRSRPQIMFESFQNAAKIVSYE